MLEDHDILGKVLEQLREGDKVYPLDLHRDVDTAPGLTEDYLE